MSAADRELRRIPLALLPSPLMPLERLSRHLGTAALYMKRDDLLGRILGGNKLRKLEYILPEAVEQKADTLITTGSFESNHVCLTAAAARMLGLQPVLVLMGDPRRVQPPANRRLSAMLEAAVHVVEYREDDPADRAALSDRVAAKVDELTAAVRARGGRPFLVPGGGCCVAGAASFADAFDELHRQMADLGIEAYDLALAVGTGSTFAGLWCGIARKGADVALRGVSIARRNPRCATMALEALQEAARSLDIEPPPDAAALAIDDAFIGDGYGKPTPECHQAIALLLRHEGVLLDPVYTGKAMSAVLSHIREGKLGHRPLVFWHTGGTAGLFDLLPKLEAQ